MGIPVTEPHPLDYVLLALFLEKLQIRPTASPCMYPTIPKTEPSPTPFFTESKRLIVVCSPTYGTPPCFALDCRVELSSATYKLSHLHPGRRLRSLSSGLMSLA
jgi:hypothetical protein